MFFKSAVPFAVALAVLASAPAAVQAAGFDQTSVKVPYGDLNLSTEEGQSHLMARIKYAAHEVCGGSEVRRSLSEESIYKACRADAVADGLAQVHKAAVSISTVAMK